LQQSYSREDYTVILSGPGGPVKEAAIAGGLARISGGIGDRSDPPE
jgi:hypothetical protein